MATDDPINDAPAKPRRKSRRLRWLLAFSALSVGLYVFVRLDRSVAESFGPVAVGIHDLFNQVPGKPSPLSKVGQQFVNEVKALGANPHVSVVRPGFLGHFGREESFGVVAQSRAFDDEALERLANRYGDRIRSLYLENTGVTDEGMKQLSKFTRLQTLEIRDDARDTVYGSSSITDTGVACLKGMTHLQSLNLSDLTITDAAFDAIKDMPELISLYLSQTRMKGHGLAGLKSLPRLALLNLDSCKIDEEGLKALSGAINLQILSLNRAPLNPEAIPLLKAIPALKELDITGCGFLDEEVADLKKSHPGMKIMRR